MISQAIDLSPLQAAIAVILGLATLATIGGGLYAVFRSAAQDSRIKRLQDERDDYLSRLNYVEPRLVRAEEQNEMLRELHNPTQHLVDLKGQEQRNHDEIVKILDDQTRTLRDAISHSHPPDRTS
jgi:hypothetical protein